jgi:hypothetical protein
MHPTLLTLNTIVFLLVADYKRIRSKLTRCSIRSAAVGQTVPVRADRLPPPPDRKQRPLRGALHRRSHHPPVGDITDEQRDLLRQLAESLGPSSATKASSASSRPPEIAADHSRLIFLYHPCVFVHVRRKAG